MPNQAPPYLILRENRGSNRRTSGAARIIAPYQWKLEWRTREADRF